MADRGQRCFAVAAVVAASLVLPAAASADLMPWLTGVAPIPGPDAASVQPTPAARACGRASAAARAHRTSARRRHATRARKGCRSAEGLGSRGLDAGAPGGPFAPAL